MKDERNKLQTFIANGWTEGMKILHKWGEQMNKNSHPSKNNKNKSELNGSGGGRDPGEGDKGSKEFCPGWRHQPGPKPTLLSLLDLLSRLVAPTGTKGCCHPPNPSGLASHWALDKSHLWSRAQRQAGQMAWTKGLFCSSVSSINQTIMTRNCTLTEVNQV